MNKTETYRATSTIIDLHIGDNYTIGIQPPLNDELGESGKLQSCLQTRFAEEDVNPKYMLESGEIDGIETSFVVFSERPHMTVAIDVGLCMAGLRNNRFNTKDLRKK
jgi:hypothetical protein